MSKPNTLANQLNVQEIHLERWIPFLSEFTRDYRGAHARLEIVGAETDTGFQVETQDRPFDGVSADIKDRERTVWITFASTVGDHITHGVHDASVIRVLTNQENAGAVLEIEAVDGTKSLLYLTAPDDFALPSGR